MLLIFDLDGTLIDSSRDLALSINATRAHFELDALTQEQVNSYVGEGAAVLVRRALEPEASENRIAEALTFFLDFYRAHSLEHTRLYPGMREALGALAEDRHVMAVLTNKPERISSDILSALEVIDLFSRVYGGNSLPAKKPDPVGILKLMEEAGLPASETLMIGDSRVDVETARNARVQSCGVRWGFQPETFALAAPDIEVESPGDLPSAVEELARRTRGNAGREHAATERCLK